MTFSMAGVAARCAADRNFSRPARGGAAVAIALGPDPRCIGDHRLDANAPTSAIRPKPNVSLNVLPRCTMRAECGCCLNRSTRRPAPAANQTNLQAIPTRQHSEAAALVPALIPALKN